MKILNKLKQIFFCKHKWVAAGEYFETDHRGHLQKKYIWRCSKCRKAHYGST
jgi:hypothetical protein